MMMKRGQKVLIERELVERSVREKCRKQTEKNPRKDDLQIGKYFENIRKKKHRPSIVER